VSAICRRVGGQGGGVEGGRAMMIGVAAGGREILMSAAFHEVGTRVWGGGGGEEGVSAPLCGTQGRL
jgi:hypothetical protein